MLLGKGFLYQQTAHGQNAFTLGGILPQLGQVQSYPGVFILGENTGEKGLGQKGQIGLSGGQQSSQLAVLGFIFHLHILTRGEAVLGQYIVKGIFRSGALASGVNGAATQILYRLDGVAGFHDIQNAQGVEGGQLHFALGLVVQGGSQVGGYSGNVKLALDDGAGELFRSASQSEIIVPLGFALGAVVHHLHHAHGRGTFQPGHPDGHIVGIFFRGLFFLLLLLLLSRVLVGIILGRGRFLASGQSEKQQQSEEKG